MKSRKRPYGSEHVPLDVTSLRRSGTRTETDRQGREWTVRTVTGSDKTYRCPGCGGDIPPGARHVVAWTSDHIFGPDAGLSDRRHWHTQCWGRR